MRKIGGILLGIGVGILAGWGLYQLFGRAFPSLALPVKIAITAIAIGLIILLASLGRERYRAQILNPKFEILNNIKCQNPYDKKGFEL